jgi:hypothetical protein
MVLYLFCYAPVLCDEGVAREAEASRQIPTQKMFDMTQSEQFDTELFILEIEERPALWNNALKEYSDKTVRKSMWEEIVQKFGGEELDVEEKQ